MKALRPVGTRTIPMNGLILSVLTSEDISVRQSAVRMTFNVFFHDKQI